MWLCILGTLFLAQRGLQTVAVGGKCSDDSHCGSNNVTQHCFEGVCSCTAGHVQTDDKRQCVPQVIGRSCIMSSEDCGGVVGAHCDNGRCACLRDSHVPSFNKTMCLPVVTKLLGYCEEDQQCNKSPTLQEDTMCVNRECVCRYGPTNILRPCRPKKKLDDWCSHSQECQTIAHASCVQKKCACDPYFVPHSFSREECVPVATTYRAPCIENFQCTVLFGAGGYCSDDNKCLCRNRHHFVVNGTISCVLDKGLDEACNTSNECFLPLDGGHQRVECSAGQCKCSTGFEAVPFVQSCTSAGSLLSIFAFHHLIIACLSIILTYHGTNI